MSKKYRLFTLSLLGIAMLSFGTNAQAERQQSAFSVGLSTVPIQLEGLEDIHVSDWENYGLGGAEGRIALPLSKGNTSAPAAPGVKIGYNYRLPQVLDLSFDLGIYHQNVSVITLGFGADLYIQSTDWVRWGVMGRFGFIGATMAGADAEVLSGYQAPVITNMGTIRNGDRVSASMGGVLTSAGVVAEFPLSETLSFRAESQFFYGILGDLNISARAPGATSSSSSSADNSVTIDVDDPSVVKTDGSSTQAGIDPTGSSMGVSGSFALVWEI